MGHHVAEAVTATQEASPEYIVATRLIRCIDDQVSEEVEYWMPEDGRPEKVGDSKVFRTWGWTIALIVSEELKEALERMGATGAKFKEV